MRLLIVSHKLFYQVGDNFYASGGTPFEYNVIYQILGSLEILVNVSESRKIPPGTQPIERSIKVHRIWNKGYSRFGLAQTFALKALLQTMIIVRKNSIDLVYGKTPGDIGLAGIFGAALTNTPSILRPVGDWFSNHKLMNYSLATKVYRSLLFKLAVKECQVVLPISNAMAHQAISFGASNDKVLRPLAEPSVDQFWFDVPPLQVDDTASRLVFVGKLGTVKNVARLIKAYHSLHMSFNGKRLPELVIVGDGPLRPRLERLTIELGLDKKIFFAGWVTHEEVRRYLSQSWALVLPSVSEGLGKVIVEAMAAGRPVLASDVGGIPDLVTHGVTGYLFDPYDINDIATNIRKLLSDDARAVEMGLAGREVAKKLDKQYFIIRFNDVIQKALQTTQI